MKNKIYRNLEEAHRMPADEVRDAYIEYQNALLHWEQGKEIMELRRQGLSIAEIASKTGETITTVCVIIHNCRYKTEPGYNGTF